MSDGEEDKDEEEMDDEPVLDSQEFIQEEYDLKLLISVIISRIDHKTILKYTENSNSGEVNNEFTDEFTFFTDNLRQIFNQKSAVLDEIIRQKL
jgi:hypothetical protein